jgi:uncharacterized repeat protein (TIGR01451 family)
VIYTLTASNAGPNTATHTQLTYQLAAGLTPGSITVSGGTCATSASALITCSLGDLQAAKSMVVTVNATAAAAGVQTSTASITTTDADTAGTNNSASNSTTVTEAPSGGGGGALSVPWLIALALLLLIQKAAQFRRFCDHQRRASFRPLAAVRL